MTKIMKQVLLIGILVLFGFSGALAEVDEVPLVNKGPENEQVVLYHESHALLIGVSQYSQGWPQLAGAVNDIERVGEALRRHGFNVVTVINPTRKEMEEAFNSFINEYGHHPENRLLFYYAGHGYTLKLAYGGDMGYIIPGDTPRPEADKAGFLKTAMDMQLVEVFAKRIQAKHALFMFDSCFSGSIFSLSRGIPENISIKVNQPVRQFITAGGADEKVPDESIFSAQFIEALNGAADFDKDGFLTGTELGEFLHKQVTNYSKGTQHPQYGKIRDPHLDKGDFVFLYESSPSHFDNASFSPERAAPKTTSLSIEEIHALLPEVPSTKTPQEKNLDRKRLFEKNLIGMGTLNQRTLLASADTPVKPEVCIRQCESRHQDQLSQNFRQCSRQAGVFKLQHESSRGRVNECMSFDLSRKTRHELRMCLAQCRKPN